ncbi:hypothetical protein [Desulfobulbus propionicus]|jgi:hypothetical protein
MKGIGNREPTAPVCAGIGLVGEQVQLFLGRLVLKFGFLFLRGIFFNGRDNRLQRGDSIGFFREKPQAPQAKDS